MLSSKTVFFATRRKITLFFVVLSSVLLLANTLIVILLIRFEITRQAKEILQTALESVQADYQANRLSNQRISSVFQFDTSQRAGYDVRQSAPNVADTKTIEPQSGQLPQAKSLSDQSQNETSTIIANEESSSQVILEKNRQVYSRVVSASGDVLFSSDLFESYNIDPKVPGFFTFESLQYCVHVMTALPDNNGSVIQVGRYCSFSLAQQLVIFIQMGVVVIMAMVATTFLGWFMSGQLLKPFQTAIQHTRQFAQTCYHELMTPLTVAMSSVSAALQGTAFKSGLQSVEQDLRDIYFSLHTLSTHALQQQSAALSEPRNMSVVVHDSIKKLQAFTNDNQVQIDSSGVEKNVMITAQDGVFTIVCDNILTNAVKYSRIGSVIALELTKHSFCVKNHVNQPKQFHLQQLFERGYRGENSKHHRGYGLGLAIVKELAQAAGWKVSAHQDGEMLEIKVLF